MGDAVLAFRAAQIELLRSDSAMTTLVNKRVWDMIPQDEVFPYVRVGDDLVLDYGSKSESGQEFDFTIHTFDRTPKRGRWGVDQIAARIYDLFHEQQIVVTGFQPYLCRFRQSRVDTGDNLTWHCSSNFRLLL